MKPSALAALRTKFFNSLPKAGHCQKCNRTRMKKFFGVRLMNGSEVEKGKPPKFLRQSYCNDCRHGDEK